MIDPSSSSVQQPAEIQKAQANPPTAAADLQYANSTPTSHIGRNLLLGALAVFMLAVGAYSSYTLGQKSVEKQRVITNTPTISLPTAAPTQEAPSNSATYTDPVFGVSFSYPRTWEVTHVEAIPSYWLRISPKGDHSNNNSGPILFAIGEGQVNQPVNPKDFLRTNRADSVTAQITVAGQVGYLQTLSNCEPFLCDQMMATAHNSKAYLLESFQFQQNPPDQKAVFQQILDSLQFTK